DKGMRSTPYLVRVKSGRLLADTWSQKMGYFILRPKYGNGKKKAHHLRIQWAMAKNRHCT
ncbi:MAG: hypothetical protein ACI81A_002721, partial [Paraglaciecola sp.]